MPETPLHFSAVILAAGKGKRMKSALPKVLHPVAGQPMITHVARAVAALKPSKTVLVLAPDMQKVADTVGLTVAIQHEQKGTGHAVNAARALLQNENGKVLIAYGDTPLITPQTLKKLVTAKAPLALLGVELENPKGYGRVVVEAGKVTSIVEEKDASAAQKKITLCNSGMIAVEGKLLWRLLEKLTPNNAQGEYYLTDIVRLAHTESINVEVVQGEATEALGVNSRAEQAAAEAVMQERLRATAMQEGVTLIAPHTVFLSAATSFGRDVIVHPFVSFSGEVEVADGVEIKSFSHIDNARIGKDSIVGPYARLRPGAQLEEGVYIGNFVEIKKSRVESGAKINHLAYVGDASVGEGANIGAGAITCNFDGKHKHQTTIGAGAFIGSNASLVAPVEIGAGAVVAAGSVITKDVPTDALAISRTTQATKAGYRKKPATSGG